MSRKINTRPGARSGAGPRRRRANRAQASRPAGGEGARRRKPTRNGSATRTRKDRSTQTTSHGAVRPSGQDAARKSTKSRVREIRLCVHEIECIKTTCEIDKDEIELTCIQTMGKVRQNNGRASVKPKSSRGKTIKAGKFKKGTKARYARPRTLASFPLGPSHLGWPRKFPVQALLIEVDRSRVKQLVDDLIDKFDDAAASKAAEAMSTVAMGAAAAAIGTGAAIGTTVFPLVGTAVGAATTAGVMAISGIIRGSSADDPFPLRNVELSLREKPAAPGIIGRKKTVKFKGHKGEYRMICSWKAA